MREIFLILAILGAFASASILDNGLEMEDTPETITDLHFDEFVKDKMREAPKHHRNPFAKMFPQFEQVPVSENETGEEK